MTRNPRTDPRAGDVLLRLDWGPRGKGGVKFYVCRIGPHRSHGEQVVCRLERADGTSIIAHAVRSYSLRYWPETFARALVCVKSEPEGLAYG